MSIAVSCVKCGNELDTPGGLLIGVPIATHSPTITTATKAHLCVDCYAIIVGVITGKYGVEGQEEPA